MTLSIVILAAGKGTRMKSAKAKVLHELAGKPLLGHVINVAEDLNPAKLCIVYGHGGDQLKAAFAHQSNLSWAEQAPQLGTGHAVQQALGEIAETETVLILYGDVPMTSLDTLQRLLNEMAGAKSLGLLTAKLDDPSGYGRIVRDGNGRVVEIVEEKDANAQQKTITEINTGIMAIPVGLLKGWLERINNQNSQGEYYLTDVIALAVADGVQVATVQPDQIEETLGINSQMQLAQLERWLQQQTAQTLMSQGVALRDPARFDLRGKVTVGNDVVIDIDVVLSGNVEIGDNVTIEPFCHIKDSKIGNNAVIHSHSILEQCEVGEACTVGPFARLRPETVLSDKSKIGNFVEIKKSTIGIGSKVNHLSYVGDSELGAKVNVGAGTITCNYDGANKYKTIIGDNAFIGSDTQLVAPVTVGANATIGAGSTITKDVPEGGLTLSRVKQHHIQSWQRPVKKNK